MHFYNHHIGEHKARADHLSLLEEGVLRRLLDAYYSREAPLPLDAKAVARLVRASTKAERAAVEQVLGEFFQPTPDGWRNTAADEQIAKYKDGEPERERRRENARERQQRCRDDRSKLFDALKERGIVPDWNTPTQELRQLLSGAVTPPVTRDETVTERLTNTNTKTNTNNSTTTTGEHPSKKESLDVVDVPGLPKDPIQGRPDISSLLNRNPLATPANPVPSSLPKSNVSGPTGGNGPDIGIPSKADTPSSLSEEATPATQAANGATPAELAAEGTLPPKTVAAHPPPLQDWQRKVMDNRRRRMLYPSFGEGPRNEEERIAAELRGKKLSELFECDGEAA